MQKAVCLDVDVLVKAAEGFSVCQMHKGFLQVGMYCVVLVMLVLEYIHVYYLRCRVLL